MGVTSPNLGRTACCGLIAVLLIGVSTEPASAQSLRGSRASVDRQNQQARQHDFTFLRRPAQLERFVDAGLRVDVGVFLDLTRLRLLLAEVDQSVFRAERAGPLPLAGRKVLKQVGD